MNAREALQWILGHYFLKEQFDPWRASSDNDKQECTYKCWGCEGEFVSSWHTNPRWIVPTIETFPHESECKIVQVMALTSPRESAQPVEELSQPPA